METIPNNIKKSNYVSYESWVADETQKIAKAESKYKNLSSEIINNTKSLEKAVMRLNQGMPLLKGKLEETTHKTPPKEYREEGATEKGDYADSKNYKYPLHKEENVKAALSYFAKPKNHNMYSPEERKSIARRIVSAAGKYKIEISDDWKEKFGLKKAEDKLRDLLKSKYTRRTPKPGGGYNYEYPKEKKGGKKKSGEDGNNKSNYEKVMGEIKNTPSRQLEIYINRYKGKPASESKNMRNILSTMEKELEKRVGNKIKELEPKLDGSLDIQTSFISEHFDVSSNMFNTIAGNLGYKIKTVKKDDVTILKAKFKSKKMGPSGKWEYKYEEPESKKLYTSRRVEASNEALKKLKPKNFITIAKRKLEDLIKNKKAYFDGTGVLKVLQAGSNPVPAMVKADILDRLNQVLLKASQLEIGKKIEQEHVKDKSLQNLYKQDKPDILRITETIAKQHLVESDDYYTRLVEMEKQMEDDKSLSDLDKKIIRFFVDNPDPDDKKVHAFAESLGIEPDKLESMIYKLATDRATMSKDVVSKAEDRLRDLLLKARTKKYIKRVPKPGGGYRYYYHKPKIEDTKEIDSITGFSKQRAKELTGVSNPSVAEIRNAFNNMTSEEQSKEISKVEKELTEAKNEIKTQMELRKDAPADSKSVYTDKIKRWNKVVQGKEERLKEFKQQEKQKKDTDFYGNLSDKELQSKFEDLKAQHFKTKNEKKKKEYAAAAIEIKDEMDRRKYGKETWKMSKKEHWNLQDKLSKKQKTYKDSMGRTQYYSGAEHETRSFDPLYASSVLRAVERGKEVPSSSIKDAIEYFSESGSDWAKNSVKTLQESTQPKSNTRYRNISYKEASKLPKGGAVAMDYTNLQATAADTIGRRFAMRPESLFNWGKKHNINLMNLIGKISMKTNFDEFMGAVLNDKPFKVKNIIKKAVILNQGMPYLFKAQESKREQLEHKTPPKEYREEGATEKSDYAIPNEYKYPLHTEKNVRAALGYFGKPKNYGMYKLEERKTIAGRIVIAANKFKIEVSDDWKEKFGLKKAENKLRDLLKAVPKSTYSHPDKPGAGAKKRKKLKKPKDKVEAVMGEFKRGTLRSGSGHKVTDRDQAVAIAMSEAGLSKK